MMKLTKQATDEAILRELGGRLAAARLAQNLTQAQLAMQAGVSNRTVQRLESGAVAAQLSGFIRICRVLDLIGRIESLFPEPIPSPIEQLKMRAHKRRRASANRVGKTSTKKWPKKWQWGDEP